MNNESSYLTTSEGFISEVNRIRIRSEMVCTRHILFEKIGHKEMPLMKKVYEEIKNRIPMGLFFPDIVQYLYVLGEITKEEI